MHELVSLFFDIRVKFAILKPLLRVNHINIVHVGHDVVSSVFALRQICQHRWVFRLRECQLVVGKRPERFSLGVIACLNLSTGHFTPGTLTYNASDVVVEAEAFGPIRHQDGVIEVEMENVTTFVALLCHFQNFYWRAFQIYLQIILL